MAFTGDVYRQIRGSDICSALLPEESAGDQQARQDIAQARYRAVISMRRDGK